MGVPVVTLRGTRHGGRVGASLLGRIGAGEWIADTVEDYVTHAAALAADRNISHATPEFTRTRCRLAPVRPCRLYARHRSGVSADVAGVVRGAADLRSYSISPSNFFAST